MEGPEQQWKRMAFEILQRPDWLGICSTFRKAMKFCFCSDRRCYSPFTVSLWRPWNINNCRSQRVFQQHQCEQLSLERLWRLNACKSRTPVTRIYVIFWIEMSKSNYEWYECLIYHATSLLNTCSYHTCFFFTVRVATCCFLEEHSLSFKYMGENDDESFDMAFNKKRADDRKDNTFHAVTRLNVSAVFHLAGMDQWGWWRGVRWPLKGLMQGTHASMIEFDRVWLSLVVNYCCNWLLVGIDWVC